jgi:transposase-like protein
MTTRAAPAAPPFCPNEHCAYHGRTIASWRWIRAGFFTRRASPQRIQRFRCGHCGRYFSTQTFRNDYWFKRPELLEDVFHAMIHCTCFRQLARKLNCSPQTILHHVRRLGRHCLLFHQQLRPKGEFTESVALDSLRTFEWSQYHPSEFHLLVGRGSHFVHGFTHSELRRSGTMTARQRVRRVEIELEFGRPDPRSVEREVTRLLEIVAAGSRRMVIFTDENPAYVRALARLDWLEVEHHTVSSREPRTTSNPLWVSNLLDGLIRHSCSNHKRETIAFSRETGSSVARMWVMVAWRNYSKWCSEQRHEDTPAMRLGLCSRRLSVRMMLKERLFPSQVELPEAWAEHYWGQLSSRQIGNPKRHTLKYAR